jgi:hypothetical protein
MHSSVTAWNQAQSLAGPFPGADGESGCIVPLATAAGTQIVQQKSDDGCNRLGPVRETAPPSGCRVGHYEEARFKTERLEIITH